MYHFKAKLAVFSTSWVLLRVIWSIISDWYFSISQPFLLLVNKPSELTAFSIVCLVNWLAEAGLPRISSDRQKRIPIHFQRLESIPLFSIIFLYLYLFLYENKDILEYKSIFISYKNQDKTFIPYFKNRWIHTNIILFKSVDGTYICGLHW